jgi:hypothetical protein
MTDKELLELAAKAAGIDYWRVQEGRSSWNPLTDDGDALRLAVNLRIDIHNDHHGCEVRWGIGEHLWENHTTEIAATRRAIVRAAAEIGKGMK